MSTINYDRLEDWASEFIEDHYFNHGNSEIVVQDGEMYVSFEAPRHTTLGFWLSIEDLARVNGSESDFRELLKERVAVRVDEFDVNETFEEYWSAEFAKQNGFTATGFLKLLNEDRDFFRDVVFKF